MQEIVTYLEKNHISYEKDVDLKDRTWIHRGGVAKLWITPISPDELVGVCRVLYSNQTYFKVVGHTSNLYFKNEYNPSIIVSTAKLTHFEINNDCIWCESGVPVKQLAKYAVKNGYKGFEGLIDLPGTVAAAVYNNSSCYNCSISGLLKQIEFLTPNGDIRILTPSDLVYSERSSILKRKELSGIIVSIQLKIQKDQNPTTLMALAEKNHKLRQATQEKPARTLGSIFPMTVVTAFEDHLSFGTKGLILCLRVFRRLHLMSDHKYCKYKRDCILLCNGLWNIRRYVSEYTFNTFIWKDGKADNAFDQYRSFIQKTTNSQQIEIEIIEKE